MRPEKKVLFALVIRTFLNGQRANGYSYAVDWETMADHDLSRITQSTALDHLIEMAIEDVRTEKWEQFTKVFQK